MDYMGESVDAKIVFGWNIGSGEDYPDKNEWAAPLRDLIEEIDDAEEALARFLGFDLVDPWDELEGKPDGWFYAPSDGWRRPHSAEYDAWLSSTEEARDAYSDAKKAASGDLELVVYGGEGYTAYAIALKVEILEALDFSPKSIDVVALAEKKAELTDRLMAAVAGVDLEFPGPPEFLLLLGYG